MTALTLSSRLQTLGTKATGLIGSSPVDPVPNLGAGVKELVKARAHQKARLNRFEQDALHI